MASFIMKALVNNRIGIGLSQKLSILVALVLFADWLFYSQPFGISAALFILAIVGAILACNPSQDNHHDKVVSAVVLCAALPPLVESFGFLSVLFSVMGIGYFAAAITAGAPNGVGAKLRAPAQFIAMGLFQCLPDLIQLGKTAAHTEAKTPRIRGLVVWIVPIVLTGVFTVLFASANPLIGDWLAHIDLWAIISLISFPRLAFWLVAMITIWPFIFVRPFGEAKTQSPASVQSETVRAEIGQIFGEASILRSIVLCNILFAIQTITDIAYLWLGVTLPEGLTYAAYAHRGAYLLIVTALLAGCFIIAAMRPGSAAEKSPLTRILVYVWIAQNILLVVSSALRLNLYVEVYSLTLWRAAAFVWMFLVAIGLVAIVTRIFLNRSNSWLVSTMLFVSVATLYVCSFVDLPRLIATYNVAHCREVTGKGAALDLAYLTGLGPDVIPALDDYWQQTSSVEKQRSSQQPYEIIRQQLVKPELADMTNWRAWSFRRWRLKLYLDHRSSEPQG